MTTARGLSHRWRALKTPANIVFFQNLQNFNHGLKCSNFIETFKNIIKYLNLSIGGVSLVKQVLV
jgi:hypothetical protein